MSGPKRGASSLLSTGEQQADEEEGLEDDQGRPLDVPEKTGASGSPAE